MLGHSVDKFLTDKQKHLIDHRNELSKSQKYKLRASVKRTVQCYIFGILTLLISLAYLDKTYFHLLQRHATDRDPNHARHLLSDEYPRGAFSEEQLEDGAWILYFIGMLYMFVAIALVCDEFFVPAIEIIVDKTHMSPDTAGATWMAAGGSAPELFTSLIGTLIVKTDVGFGTIVGSAVFNVLFVIGCCAVFTPGDLRLTWWPFARDSLYYATCLCILAFFFGIVTPQEIYWYEALLLLSLYVGYVNLMRQNKRLHHWFYKKFLKKDLSKPRRNTLTFEPKSSGLVPAPSDGGEESNGLKKKNTVDTESAATTADTAVRATAAAEEDRKSNKGTGMVDIELGKTKTGSVAGSSSPSQDGAGLADGDEDDEEEDDDDLLDERDTSISITGSLQAYDQPRGGKPIEFHISLFDFMTKDNNLAQSAGVHMVARIRGEVKDTFNYIDKNRDNNIDMGELKAVLGELGESIAHADAVNVFDEIDTDGNGLISFKEFEQWYLKSAAIMRQDVRRLFKKFDVNDDDHIDATELKSLLTVVNDNKEPSQEELLKAMRELDKQKNGRFNEDQFVQWWENSSFFDAKQELRQRTLQLIEDDDDEGIDLTFPETWRARIMYIISGPIIYPLWLTLADVQKEENEDKWAWTFVGSILWLGVFSYVMVWFAIVIGEALNIPDEVMGLTFLAAGTSVPDLLTSVIVARHGEADMAVSSSIGSNIFDILIGLPFPWLLYCAIFPEEGGKVPVHSKSLFFSIILLVIMLLTVLGIIKLNKWKMTHSLGYAMFALYVFFVIQDLLRSMTHTLDFLNF